MSDQEISTQDLIAEIDAVTKELADEDLEAVPQEKVVELLKKVNPYGRTIESRDTSKYLNVSVTQIEKEYQKKLLVSGFIGYLFRMCDEWKVPHDVPVVRVTDYLDDPSKIEPSQGVLEKASKKTLDNYQFNKEYMQKRVHVYEFLEEMFQFNPEEHVRSAYRPYRPDPERKPINTPAGELAVKHLRATDKKFRAQEELYDELKQAAQNDTTDVNNQSNAQDSKTQLNTTNDQAKPNKPKTKIIRRTIIGKDGKKRTITKEVRVEDDEPGAEKLIADNNNKDVTAVRRLREFLPPHDIFERFRNYYESNYEDIRDFVRDAYCEKPMFELAILPYAMHDNEDDAENFKRKNADQVIAEIYTVQFGKWNFFDHFKEQRENTSFYNEKTGIIEEMMRQAEADKRLGADMLKKRVAKEKKINVLEEGPDAASFKEWRAQNDTLTKMGAEYIGDATSDDIPEDAIEVPVWKVAKSGTELVRDKFYTAAEAPTFVDDAETKNKISTASGK